MVRNLIRYLNFHNSEFQVVDPWGTVIAQCSEGTDVAIAHIDTSYIQQVRSSMPVWQHRRNDLYAAMSPLKTAVKSEEIDDNATYRFGSTTVHGSTVFYKTNKSLAFTNKKCAVPGRILQYVALLIGVVIVAIIILLQSALQP